MMKKKPAVTKISDLKDKLDAYRASAHAAGKGLARHGPGNLALASAAPGHRPRGRSYHTIHRPAECYADGAISYLQFLVVYKKRMLFCIFSCTNSVRQFILSAWLLKLLIVGTVEVKISLNLARRPTINSATAAMIVVNKAAKTPQ